MLSCKLFRIDLNVRFIEYICVPILESLIIVFVDCHYTLPFMIALYRHDRRSPAEEIKIFMFDLNHLNVLTDFTPFITRRIRR